MKQNTGNQPHEVFLALYHGERDGAWYQPSVVLARFSDWAIRKATRGRFSHCEIAVKTGNLRFTCYSSSIRDGGVRMRIMPLPADKWTLIPLGNSPDLYQRIRQIFKEEAGKPYDWQGALGIILPFRQRGKKWFCSELCAQMIGLPESWRYSPNNLASLYQGSFRSLALLKPF